MANAQAGLQANITRNQANMQADIITNQSGLQADLIKSQADTQATFLEQSAGVARSVALTQATMIRKAQKSAIATSTTAAAASGVVVGQDSAAEADRKIYEDSEHDAFTAIANGDRVAQSARTDANLTRANGELQSSLTRSNGKLNAVMMRTTGTTNAALTSASGQIAESNANMNAVGSVLSGGSKMISMGGWKTAKSTWGQ